MAEERKALKDEVKELKPVPKEPVKQKQDKQDKQDNVKQDKQEVQAQDTVQPPNSATPATPNPSATDAAPQQPTKEQDEYVREIEKKIWPLKYKLNEIKVSGNEVTDSEFIKREFEPLNNSKDFKELYESSIKSRNDLMSLGIFKTAKVSLDPGPLDKPDTVDLDVKVDEKSRLGGSVNVMREINTSENSGVVSANVRNIFGSAESLGVSVGRGDQSGYSFALNFLKPRFWKTRGNFSMGIFNQMNDFSMSSSYRQAMKGFNIGLSDEKMRHEVSYEAALRDISPSAPSTASFFGFGGSGSASAPSLSVSPSSASSSSSSSSSVSSSSSPSSSSSSSTVPLADQASVNSQTNSPSLFYTQPCAPGVLNQCFSSTKSALKYTYTIDHRDDRFAPKQGSMLQLSSEVAGLGGDAEYLKGESLAQKHFPLSKSWSFGVSALAGLLRPWSTFMSRAAPVDPRYAKQPYICDRFFLGGPLNLRGFAPRSVGPIQLYDSLGGDTYMAFGGALTYFLPGKWNEQFGARLSWFCNAGNNLSAMSLPSGVGVLSSQVGRQYFREMRVSTGLAMVLPTSIGRFELGFALPLRSNPNDRCQGVQLGLGMNFM
eukprot:TRINITY_DN394_c5_g1_i1.p1 TRINITY_DN394_c5_g1~~TRINITY_DN394_c5_g1_i1.p1  ORF type:complete len:601 (+),score=210.07 TRINITY_DN394_c5_g1_i1:40-1842(+)